VNHEKRQNQTTYLNEELFVFSQTFLTNCNYYYLPINDFYYKYDGTNFYIVKEDEILHKILMSISNEDPLIQWKYKTKSHVMKQIKERSLFSCVPEKRTICSVLNMLQKHYFPSKCFAEYFLTIIGDNILKKNNDLIFIINAKMKLFFDELEKTSISSLFNDCRLLKIKMFQLDDWREHLKKFGLNLLCVAVPYSNIHKSSDHFILHNKANEDVMKYTFFLKNTTQNQLIEQFIDSFLQKTTDDSAIEWKDIYCLWKQFLTTNDLPNVVFSHHLKQYMKQKFSCDSEKETFIGVTSCHLPIYKKFIDFWNTNMIETKWEEKGFVQDFDIQEIYALYNAFSKRKNEISVEEMLNILKYVFSIEPVEEMYILHYTTPIWDKQQDIEKRLAKVKEQLTNEKDEEGLLSFDKVYSIYLETTYEENWMSLSVSKRYFEKYFNFKYNYYVYEYDKDGHILYIDNAWVDIPL
jgi:hypothetical protein